MKKLIFAPLLLVVGCGSDDPEIIPCDSTVVGNICTVVGTGDSGYSGDDGPAIEAVMSLPQDTLFAPDGTLYILDWNNHRVRKMDPDGTMRHVAGRGELFGPGDDPANSDLNHPTSFVLHPSGESLEIAAWHNSKLRSSDLATGEIVDTCGDGRRAYFGDDGPAMTASLDLPASLAYAPNGDMIVMDQANQVLRSIDAAGNIHLLAGRCVIDAGATCEAPVQCPAPSGKWTCGDPAMTCGMPCTPRYAGDGGPAADMRIAQPFGQSADPAGRIVFDDDGNLYFADTSNQIIRVIDTEGNVDRVAGTAPVDGVAQAGYEGDGGDALDARLNNPVDLALADDGTLYISDVYNHCIRAVAPDGTIDTVVGTCGTDGYDGDHGPALDATLKRPYGIELGGDFLYIADTGNNVIRAVRLR
jgi:hypothetical protein